MDIHFNMYLNKTNNKEGLLEHEFDLVLVCAHYTLIFLVSKLRLISVI